MTSMYIWLLYICMYTTTYNKCMTTISLSLSLYIYIYIYMYMHTRITTVYFFVMLYFLDAVA